MTASAAPTPVLRPDWSLKFLRDMRTVGDAEADAVADEVLEAGGADLVNRAWRLMLSRHEILDEAEFANLPKLRAYLSAKPSLPKGTNEPRLLQGQIFFATWGPLICLGLLTCSLPSSYAAANGVRVIAMTGRLETDTRRRIWETAKLLVDAFEPGGLDPDNADARGFTTVRNVRLMHAYIRRLLESGHWANTGRNVSGLRRLRRPLYRPSAGAWRTGLWGKPINQEDLAGTLMAFGWLPIVSIRKGPDSNWLDQQAIEDFIYAWTVIGRMLGVDERLLPETEAQARELHGLIAYDQHKKSPGGRSMTRALVHELEMMVPGRLFDPFVRALIVDQVGDKTAAEIGLSPQPWRMRFFRAVRWLLIKGRLQKAILQRNVDDPWGYDIVGWMLGGKSKYHKNPFVLPASLRQIWGTEADADQHPWRTRQRYSTRCPAAGGWEQRASRSSQLSEGFEATT